MPASVSGESKRESNLKEAYRNCHASLAVSDGMVMTNESQINCGAVNGVSTLARQARKILLPWVLLK